MKAAIKRLMPASLIVLMRNAVEYYRLIVCTVYDFNRYINNTSTFTVNNQEKMLGKLVLHYHVIEKGLSFEERREGFGAQVLDNLIELVNKYISLDYDREQLQFLTACSVINKYFEQNNVSVGNLSCLKSKVNPVVFQSSQNELGGSQIIRKSDVLHSVNIDYTNFFSSRHSIREFSNEPVDSEKVIKALNIARKYPSVCNRQAVRTYFIDSKEKVQEHLSYQNGNRGFGELVDKLIIVVADLSVFSKADERNQPFIDGGIYLMGLLLAIHAQGLGAVALNWSTNKRSDKLFRTLGTIKESEVIISFVGIGNLKDKMIIPKSERNSLCDTLTVIK